MRTDIQIIAEILDCAEQTNCLAETIKEAIQIAPTVNGLNPVDILEIAYHTVFNAKCDAMREQLANIPDLKPEF